MVSKRPRLLDLFCGAGGAACGYQRAGFYVVGVDNQPQRRYCGEEFVQADALEYLAAHGHEFDAIHASPPCQGYSRMRHLPWLAGRVWPLLIEPTRTTLERVGKLWVIENVADAPLLGIILCGTMFGLKVFRHRRFESNILLMQPPHEQHREVIGDTSFNSRSRPNVNGFIGNPGKHPAGTAAMGINWMTAAELQDAIPPAYTEFVGRQLLVHLGAL